MIFESNQNVNISIRHRFLSKNKNYLFEFIFQIDIVIDQFLIEIQTMIENDQKIISMNNFEITQIKILKNQIINRVFTLFRNATSTIINFAFAKIFVEKTHVKSNMFFIVQYSNEKIINKTNISNHWNLKFRSRVQNIFDRHNNLFRKKLKKLKNDIKMSIFFVNESNVFDLKQNFYFLTIKNKKTMNEIFDFLLKQSRIQKFFLIYFRLRHHQFSWYEKTTNSKSLSI